MSLQRSGLQVLVVLSHILVESVQAPGEGLGVRQPLGTAGCVSEMSVQISVTTSSSVMLRVAEAPPLYPAGAVTVISAVSVPSTRASSRGVRVTVREETSTPKVRVVPVEPEIPPPESE